MSVAGLNNGYYNAYNAYSYNYQAKTGGDSISVSALNQKSDEIKKSNQVEGPKECQTCKNRKYKDQSDDSSVSFQSAQSIPSGMAYGVVAAHESEHVRNEQARAMKDGKKVVYQTVSIQTAICPECGKMYVAGGTTHTVTQPDNSKNQTNTKQITDILPGMLYDKAG